MIKETQRNHKNSFIRIFPTKLFPKYEKFLEHSQNWTVYRQLNGFLFANKTLQSLPRHLTEGSSSPPKLKYPQASGSASPRHQLQARDAKPPSNHQISRNDSQEADITPDEIVLTGDDLVVEYASRLADALRDRSDLPSHLSSRIEQFIGYKVWSVPNLPSHI